MKKVLLAMLLCGISQAISAQYAVNNALPVPTPLPATSVSEYGYQANWETVSDVEGYGVVTYLTNRASKDDEKLYLFNEDFSDFASDYTIESPNDNGTSSNGWVMDRLENINRFGWQIGEAIYANGVIGFNGIWRSTGLGINGQILSPAYDLSLGNGKVYVEPRSDLDDRVAERHPRVRRC